MAKIPLLRVGLEPPVPTLNIARSNYASLVDSLTLDTLETQSPQGKLLPPLALSSSHPDAVTYVYHLRQDVKFWDGQALTAADVAYSYNWERAPGSLWGAFFEGVKSISAAGPYTVKVVMDSPNVSWPAVPACPGFVGDNRAWNHSF
jgi:peptide/nickel transport system substrate-binding protein